MERGVSFPADSVVSAALSEYVSFCSSQKTGGNNGFAHIQVQFISQLKV